MARNSIEEKSATAREPCNGIYEPSGSTQVLVDVPPLYTSCEESNDDNDDNGNVDLATLKKDLKNSFTQFEKSIEKKGLNVSKLNPHSLYWDHKGMDVETYPVCTHVSEGEEHEELLKNLEALDPCGKFDDDAFPQRVQNFLRQYEEEVSEAVAEKIQRQKKTLSFLKMKKW